MEDDLPQGAHPSPDIGRRRILAVGALAAALPLAARAQGRPFTIVVPQPAGNPGDAFGRKLQPLLQRELGQPVIVENVPGAGGSIGVQRVLNGPADGQTATLVSQTEPILMPLALASARYQPTQLRPVGLLGRGSYVLAGRADLPANTHAELLAWVRSRGGQPPTYGHIGNGSMIHLLGEQWRRSCQVAVLHVPYKGVPPLLQELVGGQIDLSFVPLGGLSSTLIDGGKLKVFGVTAAQPVAQLPKVPALSSLDPALRGFVYEAWGSLMVPRGTPEAAAARWQRAFAVAVTDPEVVAFLRSNGTDPQPPLSLEALETFYDTEVRRYQQMARAIGITPE
jgi:tripartite-type tricarboxylate transporter receptor subunit TctC